MKTYYLDENTINAYLADLLVNRLPQVIDQSRQPLVFCPIGISGMELYSRLSVVARTLVLDHPKIQRFIDATIIKAIYDRKNGAVAFVKISEINENHGAGFSLEENIKSCHLIVLDSSVHSGCSMRSIMDDLIQSGAGTVTAYSLVVKATSRFIPNFFSLIIGHDDRALFMLPNIPNNRVMPTGVLRMLDEKDIARKSLVCGVSSLDRIKWSDLYYSTRVHPGQHVYVYENLISERTSAFLGYISMNIPKSGDLFIDTLVVDQDSKGQKVGANLMRFADTLARHTHCRKMGLWALHVANDPQKDSVGFYEKCKFEKVPGQRMILPEKSGNETYLFMQRMVMPHRLLQQEDR